MLKQPVWFAHPQPMVPAPPAKQDILPTMAHVKKFYAILSTVRTAAIFQHAFLVNSSSPLTTTPIPAHQPALHQFPTASSALQILCVRYVPLDLPKIQEGLHAIKLAQSTAAILVLQLPHAPTVHRDTLYPTAILFAS